VTPNDIRSARAELGNLWGLDRHLTMAELGRVLRMRGDSAADMIYGYEMGKREPTGPVTLAIELMREPSYEQIDAAIIAVGHLSAEPHAATLGELLVRCFGPDAHAVLEDIVLTVSDTVRRPRGVEEAVEVSQFHSRDRRYRGNQPIVTRRRRRA
jgi:hypothetical protein